MSTTITNDKELKEVADMDSIRDHRFIVAAATIDELDRRPSDEVDIGDVSLSVADTEAADNTHPYLMRYADIYAHSQEFSDPVELTTGNTKFIKISNSTEQGEFQKGEVVMYHDKESNTSYEATIVDVHYDEMKQPHYDLMFKGGDNQNGDENEDTVRFSVKDDSIKQQPRPIESADEIADEANAVKCVNFDINPTPLFLAMYNGDWEAALARLQSNPEEACVWVARYNTQPDDIKVFRWRLLPLHLCVALNGSNDDDDDDDVGSADAPDDEKDDDEEEELDHKENKKQPPPRILLVALLKAYPQAAQCADDQNLIPLHSAIRGNTSITFIKELLKSDPASVYCKDARGRNAHTLAKKVFGRRSNQSHARKLKYEKLKKLLQLAGTHPDAKLKEQQQQYESRMNDLQNLNLSLRRDNALLRTRCERNEDLLEKLVQKLQEYQQVLDGDLSKHVESFDLHTSEEFSYSRMESIPPPPPSSLPAIEDDDAAENWKVAYDAKSGKEYYFNKKTRVVSWVKPECLEENDEILPDSEDSDGEENVDEEEKKVDNKVIGGKGAYAKRIERHIQTAMSYDKSEDVLVTPISTRTGSTEAMTPDTWQGRNLALELESFDEEDKSSNPFVADLTVTSSEEIDEGTSAAIFRSSSHNDKDNNVSFTNADAFIYSDVVKIGEAEKVIRENCQEQSTPKVTFKDAAGPERKQKKANPAVSAEIERLRRKFSEES